MFRANLKRSQHIIHVAVPTRFAKNDLQTKYNRKTIEQVHFETP